MEGVTGSVGGVGSYAVSDSFLRGEVYGWKRDNKSINPLRIIVIQMLLT
jgi:hypothetical protein